MSASSRTGRTRVSTRRRCGASTPKTRRRCSRRSHRRQRTRSRMDLSLVGKVAIVGGASQGIGFAIARLLAAEGARVAIVARRNEPLERAAATIGGNGGDVHAIAADIRKADDCERIVASALERFGRLDALVNNDGAPPLGSLHEFDDVAW